MFGVGALVFSAGAYLIVAAMIVRRRRMRFVRQQQESHAPSHRSSTMPDLRQPNGETNQRLNRRGTFNHNDELRGLPPVRTLHLLLYLSTVLVWEMQIACLLLRVLGGVQLAAIWRHSLLGIYIVVTLFAVWFGRRDIQRLRNSRG